MADSSIAVTPGAGANVDTRTEPVNGDHRQVTVTGDGATAATQTVSAVGAALIGREHLDPAKGISSRYPGSGHLLFVEDFRHPNPSFFNDGLGGASRDNEITFNGRPTLRLDPQGNSTSVTSVTAPTGPAASAGGTGGTLASATYFYKVTAYNNVGETTGSTEVSAAVTLGQKVTVSWTRMDGALGYKIYRSTSTGTETLLTTVSGNGTTSFVDDGSVALIGTALPGSNSTGGPGRTASTTGVVAKRRILDGFTDCFGIEVWFRMTSTSMNSTAVAPIIAVYNRDGSSAWHGRLWLNPMGNNVPMHGWILDGGATAGALGTPGTGTVPVWKDAVTSTIQNGAGTHTYDPNAGGLDRSGGWHYAKLVVDLKNKKYVGCVLDGSGWVDLSAYNLDQTTTSGFAGMHFSVELQASTSTRRFMNVAQVVGTRESL